MAPVQSAALACRLEAAGSSWHEAVHSSAVGPASRTKIQSVLTGKGHVSKNMSAERQAANQPVAGKMGKRVGRKLASGLEAGQEGRQQRNHLHERRKTGKKRRNVLE
jgi:hypothetical protein